LTLAGVAAQVLDRESAFADLVRKLAIRAFVDGYADWGSGSFIS
jgi:hypothetical protein